MRQGAFGCAKIRLTGRLSTSRLVLSSVLETAQKNMPCLAG